VCETFEPGATAAGAVIRELVLHGSHPVTPVAEALLMAADRAQHVAEVVHPALERGEWVVSDRFVPSSLVYQGIVRGLGVDVVRALNQPATAAVAPDVIVVLDVPEAQARARRGGAADRLEAEGVDFHTAVGDAYRSLARDEGWLLVDGAGSIEEVAGRVADAVGPLLAS
jgi:dTMP kinase